MNVFKIRHILSCIFLIVVFFLSITPKNTVHADVYCCSNMNYPLNDPARQVYCADGCTCLESSSFCYSDPLCSCPPTPTPTCAPNCSGKVCGSNGCGGSCGSCLDPKSCLDGQCTCDGALEQAICASRSYQCGIWSQQGCSWSCGTCNPTNDVCDQGTGQCVCKEYTTSCLEPSDTAPWVGCTAAWSEANGCDRDVCYGSVTYDCPNVTPIVVTNPPTITLPITPEVTGCPPGQSDPWYNCNCGYVNGEQVCGCYGPHSGCGVDECGGSDAACGGTDLPPDVPIDVPVAPDYTYIGGSVYVDVNKDGSFTSSSNEALFSGVTVPGEYSRCNWGTPCASAGECSGSYSSCVTGTFCCTPGLTYCTNINQASSYDDYVSGAVCTSCGSGTGRTCQESAICCKPLKDEITITATKITTGAKTSASTNPISSWPELRSGNNYAIIPGADHGSGGTFDVEVTSLPSGYIVTSTNPVRVTVADGGFAYAHFGIFKLAPNLNINGYVFVDKNKNGIKDGDDTCYTGTVNVTCCNSTNDFTVTACQPQTWCNCSDPNTIVTLHAPSGSTVKWSGTDSSGNPIGGANTDASAVLSSE
jgi:hypothetical protein